MGPYNVRAYTFRIPVHAQMLTCPGIGLWTFSFSCLMHALKPHLWDGSSHVYIPAQTWCLSSDTRLLDKCDRQGHSAVTCPSQSSQCVAASQPALPWSPHLGQWQLHPPCSQVRGPGVTAGSSLSHHSYSLRESLPLYPQNKSRVVFLPTTFSAPTLK